MPITVKARDGKTDLYGLMYQPTNLDRSQKYPIINRIYPGSADWQRRQPQLFAGAGRFAGARGARLHRGRDRRHGHPVAIEEIPRGLLRQHGRQHDPRPGGGHEAACGAASLDRSDPRRRVGALRRRLRDRVGDVHVSGLLQGRDLGIRQPRQPGLRGRLGGEVDRPAEEESRTARPRTTARRRRRWRRT